MRAIGGEGRAPRQPWARGFADRAYDHERRVEQEDDTTTTGRREVGRGARGRSNVDRARRCEVHDDGERTDGEGIACDHRKGDVGLGAATDGQHDLTSQAGAHGTAEDAGQPDDTI